MDIKNLKKIMPILQAIVDGKTIQHKTTNREWYDTNVASLDHLVTYYKDYRIKPEQKYRPFKDAKECRSEMLKHQPFGWLISQNGEVNSLIIFIDNEGIVIGDRNNGVIGFVTATDLFKIKFADGTPFGVKVEE